MKRSLAPLVALLCLSACAEEETPTILDGARGACGSVVEDVIPAQVECPSDCPIAVKAFRVRDLGTCERSANQYVACVTAGDSVGNPGPAFLDTEDGALFVDSPSIDCSDGSVGCVNVDTAVRGRWQTCADSDEEGCECACTAGECPYDRFLTTVNSCNLPSPCAQLTDGVEPTEDQLQCYMDVLAVGGPAYIEIDAEVRNQITGQPEIARQVYAVNDFEVTRLGEVAYDEPATACELQNASYFLMCDPESPIRLNFELEDGMTERLPCTDPRTWVINCEAADPVCPGTAE